MLMLNQSADFGSSYAQVQKFPASENFSKKRCKFYIILDSLGIRAIEPISRYYTSIDVNVKREFQKRVFTELIIPVALGTEDPQLHGRSISRYTGI